jgi:hypothetical protein
MSKYIVLSANPYDFENTKGDKISGVRIAYINRKSSSREGEFGNPPLITTCSLDIIKGKRLEECPAIFDMEFEQVTGKNNKPELFLTELEYIAPVDFNLFFA